MRGFVFMLVAWLSFVCPALGGEYLISLKAPKALKSVFDFKIGGSSVRDLIETKIHRQFSFGNFSAIAVDIPPVVADKLREVPFISDVVANVKISLFDEMPELLAMTDFEEDFEDDDQEDGEDSDGENDGDFISQTPAPRHLARISRRSQLPVFEVGETSSPMKYYFHEEYQGEDVYVYVLDSGINHAHPEFEGRSEKGIDTTGEGSGDYIGHGTHVAGLIGSKTYGVAKKVNLVEVKVLDSLGRGNVSDIIQGLEYVVNQCIGKKRKCVVNMSLGAPGTHTILDRALSAVIDEGIVAIVAAGNSGLNACWYSPAKVKSAITVAAIDDRTDLMAPFSNWGACIDIWAPGVNVKSLSNRNHQTALLSGTSMASPIVAGAAAILLDQGIKPGDVKKSLSKTATKGVFKRRAIAVRPRTPNKLLYTGSNQEDDEFDFAVYPLVDEEKFLNQLRLSTEYSEPKDRLGSTLKVHGRKLLTPQLDSILRSRSH